MKIRKFIFLLLFANAGYGQEFLVFKVKGNASKSSDKLNQSLKIGQLLNKNESIRLGNNSSVVLVCNNYSTITLDKSKDHLLSQYLGACIKKNSSVTADYFKFMWAALSHPEGSVEKNRREYMGNHIGAIVRGGYSLDTINNFRTNFFIRPKKVLTSSSIIFVVYDSEKNGRLLYSLPVASQTISLDSIRLYSNNNRKVFWNVTVNGNETGKRNTIRFWDFSEYQAFYQDLKDGSVSDPGSAEWHYMIGFELEANHFFGEAYEHYKNALQLEPSEKRYKFTVDDMKAKYF